MAEDKFMGAPPSPPYGPHGTLKIVAGGPEYTAGGTLKMSPDQQPQEVLENKGLEAPEAEMMTQAAEKELEEAKQEYGQAVAAIDRAQVAGADVGQVTSLREQAEASLAQVKEAEAELRMVGQTNAEGPVPSPEGEKIPVFKELVERRRRNTEKFRRDTRTMVDFLRSISESKDDSPAAFDLEGQVATIEAFLSDLENKINEEPDNIERAVALLRVAQEKYPREKLEKQYKEIMAKRERVRDDLDAKGEAMMTKYQPLFDKLFPGQYPDMQDLFDAQPTDPETVAELEGFKQEAKELIEASRWVHDTAFKFDTAGQWYEGAMGRLTARVAEGYVKEERETAEDLSKKIRPQAVEAWKEGVLKPGVGALVERGELPQEVAEKFLSLTEQAVAPGADAWKFDSDIFSLAEKYPALKAFDVSYGSSIPSLVQDMVYAMGTDQAGTRINGYIADLDAAAPEFAAGTDLRKSLDAGYRDTGFHTAFGYAQITRIGRDRTLAAFSYANAPGGYRAIRQAVDLREAFDDRTLEIYDAAATARENGYYSLDVFRGSLPMSDVPADELRDSVAGAAGFQGVDSYVKTLGYYDHKTYPLMRDAAAMSPRNLTAFGRIAKLYGGEGVHLLAAAKNMYADNPEKLTEAIQNLEEVMSSGLMREQGMREILISQAERFLSLSQEQRARYVAVLRKLDQSPSQSMQRVKFELAAQLINTEDPEGSYERIEDVFLRNNLPYAGKLLKVFSVLFGPEQLAQRLGQARGEASPTLKNERHHARMLTISKDILTIQMESNNPSLREYLQDLSDPEMDAIRVTAEPKGEADADWVRAPKVELAAMDPERLKRFDKMLRRIRTLYQASQLGRARDGAASLEIGGEKPLTAEERQSICERLAWDLKLEQGQSVADRLAEMYFRPLGYERLQDVLDSMERSRKEADQRNREFVAGGNFSLRAGDCIKGLSSRYLASSLENGFMCPECLGPNTPEGADWSPFDADVSLVLPQDAERGFSQAVDDSLAKDYGDILVITRDRGQFRKSSKDDKPEDLRRDALRRAPSNMELFATGAHGERHYGIRTGIPSTEIDGLIVKRDQMGPEKLQSLLLDIVKNGFYVPVMDQSGKVIFSPDDFDRLRGQVFSGLRAFRGPDMVLTKSEDAAPEHAEAIRALVREKQEERERIAAAAQGVRDLVAGAVAALPGFSMFNPQSDRIDGVELQETGSSGRLTNVPGKVDFDYVVRLDPNQMKQLEVLKAKLRQALADSGAKPQPDGEAPDQIRVVGANVGGQTDIEIDFTFVSKSEIQTYGSHEAAADKFSNIRENHGQEALDEVLANVALAKRILSEAGAYKKKDGGLGGMGVEMWILQNGGDVLAAFKSFMDAARKPDGTFVPFDEFKSKYPIHDPGINSRSGGHDNFINKLKEDKFLAMCKAIGEYLAKNIVKPEARIQNGV